LPGLKEKTEKKLKEVDNKNRNLTPWQEYKEKRARKKLEKKESKAVCSNYWRNFEVEVACGVSGVLINETRGCICGIL